MRPPDLSDLLSDAGARRVAFPSDKFEKWLTRRGCDPTAAFLAGCEFPTPTTDVFGFDFLTESGVIAINSAKECGVHPPLDDGLLIVATACNGDFLAVDLRDKPYEVGLIDHERVWDGGPVRELFARAAKSIDHLVRLIAQGKAPGDYAEAVAAGRKKKKK